MYDPGSARFILPDPAGFEGGDANLYRYCGNDPVNHTDPSGLDSGFVRWVLGLAGINEDVFEQLGNCAINPFDYFQGVFWSNPYRILRSAVEGITAALNELMNDWENVVRRALSNWLRLPVELFELAGNPDAQRVFPVLLRLLGIDWEGVLLAIKQESQLDIAALVYLFNQIDRDVDRDVVGTVNHWRVTILEQVDDFATKFQESLREAVRAVAENFIRGVGERMRDEIIRKLLRAVATGGIGTAIHTILVLGRSLLNRAGPLCGLIRQGLEGIQGLINGEGWEAVRDRFKAGVETALPILFAAVADQVNLGKVDDVVQRAVDRARMVAQKPLRVAAKYLGTHFRRPVDRLFGALGLGGDDRPLTTPVERTHMTPPLGRVTLWVKDKDKEPYLRYNPTVQVKALLADPMASPAVRNCRAGVERGEYAALHRAEQALLAVATKPNPKEADVKALGPLNHAVYTAEEALEGAIVRCGGLGCGTSPGGMCFGAGTLVWRGGAGRTAIEAVRLGGRVATWLPGEPESNSGPDGALDATGWRETWLTQEQPGGGVLEVGLLRPAGWLAARGIEGSGDVALLDMPEMGAVGAFAVRSVGPCPGVAAGPGRVVTGVYRHPVSRLYALPVGGEVLRVTALHPIWSVDRSGWVGATKLLPGERLRGAGGPVECGEATVIGDEPVYNLEVDADHCFRVGEHGILVHNQSTAPVAGDAAARANYDRIFCHPCKRRRVARTMVLRGGISTNQTGPFTIQAEVAANESGNALSYREADAMIRTPLAANDIRPAVCKVNSISGYLPAPPQDTPRATIGNSAYTTDLMRALLLNSQRGDTLIQNPADFDSGHLIGVAIGGPDSVYALVPMDRQLNRFQAWRNMETKISNCLREPDMQGAHVTVNVTYGNQGATEFIPTEFMVRIIFNRPSCGVMPMGGPPPLRFSNRPGDLRSFGLQTRQSPNVTAQPCMGPWS